MIEPDANSMTSAGVVAAAGIYTLKTAWETILKRGGPPKGCAMSAADSLLIQQTHGYTLETKDLLTRHLDEVSSMAESMKDLALSISESRKDDNETQQQQTKILEKLTDIIASK